MKEGSSIQYDYRKCGTHAQVVSQHPHMATAKIKLYKETEGERKKRGMSMEISRVSTRRINPDSLSLPNQNTIIINKLCTALHSQVNVHVLIDLVLLMKDVACDPI